MSSERATGVVGCVLKPLSDREMIGGTAGSAVRAAQAKEEHSPLIRGNSESTSDIDVGVGDLDRGLLQRSDVPG